MQHSGSDPEGSYNLGEAWKVVLRQDPLSEGWGGGGQTFPSTSPESSMGLSGIAEIHFGGTGNRRWEYKIITETVDEQRLNSLGSEGWEVCGVFRRSNEEVWVLKRPSD